LRKDSTKKENFCQVGAKSTFCCSGMMARRNYQGAPGGGDAAYGGTILAARDTTGVNYNIHVKTEGIISDKTLGVHVRSCLAVTAGGLVLGFLGKR
jgi:hypothetical protein